MKPKLLKKLEPITIIVHFAKIFWMVHLGSIQVRQLHKSKFNSTYLVCIHFAFSYFVSHSESEK